MILVVSCIRLDLGSCCLKWVGNLCFLISEWYNNYIENNNIKYRWINKKG